MSIGIGGKLFGKGLDLYVGKKAFTHSFRIAKVSVGDLDGPTNFSLVELEIAVRW